MCKPVIDLLDLWSDAFEMQQEKRALEGLSYSPVNPYDLDLISFDHPDDHLVDVMEQESEPAPVCMAPIGGRS